ncbi:MAG TPA: hypothetical protein VNM48_00240 [Chloroflexota bacterium]|nr:hypothetical protein [Chloroflexota bacterium]
MQGVEAVLPQIREYQVPVYESEARFKLLLCGRRWGKSKLALAAACGGHGPVRGHLRGALQGARIGWVVPSDDHPAAAEAWGDLKAAFGRDTGIGAARAAAKGAGRRRPRAAEARVSEERRLIEVPGGGSVRIWSGYDPDALRGPWFDGVVVDECSIQQARTWEVLRPTLSDYGGWGMLCGTVPPDVATHWLVGLYRYAESDAGKERGWQAWRLPSWQNPQLGAGDLEEAKETLGTRVFLREYGAELVGATGGVWRPEWFEGRAWTEMPRMTRMVVVLDAAWKTGVRHDFSVAQVWGRRGGGGEGAGGAEYYLLDELRGKWESPELRRRMTELMKVWTPVAAEHGLALPLYVEDAGGGAVAIQELRAACDFPVLAYGVRGSTKMARNEAVSPLGEARRIWVPSVTRGPWIRATLEELVGFPELPHDDRCDAWTMGLQVLQSGVAAARMIVRPWERAGRG